MNKSSCEICKAFKSSAVVFVFSEKVTAVIVWETGCDASYFIFTYKITVVGLLFLNLSFVAM